MSAAPLPVPGAQAQVLVRCTGCASELAFVPIAVSTRWWRLRCPICELTFAALAPRNTLCPPDSGLVANAEVSTCPQAQALRLGEVLEGESFLRAKVVLDEAHRDRDRWLAAAGQQRSRSTWQVGLIVACVLGAPVFGLWWLVALVLGGATWWVGWAALLCVVVLIALLLFDLYTGHFDELGSEPPRQIVLADLRHQPPQLHTVSEQTVAVSWPVVPPAHLLGDPVEQRRAEAAATAKPQRPAQAQ